MPWEADEAMLLSIVKTASECGVDMHGLIQSWSFMDVAVARVCPGLATFLAQIGVTSQAASSLGSYMVEKVPKHDTWCPLEISEASLAAAVAPLCDSEATCNPEKPGITKDKFAPRRATPSLLLAVTISNPMPKNESVSPITITALD